MTDMFPSQSWLFRARAALEPESKLSSLASCCRICHYNREQRMPHSRNVLLSGRLDRQSSLFRRQSEQSVYGRLAGNVSA